jgi:hypothetical protein
MENRSSQERDCTQRPGKEAVDNYNWRRDCTARERANVKGQMTKSTPTAPGVTFLPDEK